SPSSACPIFFRKEALEGSRIILPVNALMQFPFEPHEFVVHAPIAVFRYFRNLPCVEGDSGFK
ncbi:hypothetical protein, partial [Anoxybacillus sp.]|uniref:hypothetical protein n=1 Tax=Anoxybacillus sp. TaxID=1872573 RepID=UPI002FE3BD38